MQGLTLLSGCMWFLAGCPAPCGFSQQPVQSCLEKQPAIGQDGSRGRRLFGKFSSPPPLCSSTLVPTPLAFLVAHLCSWSSNIISICCLPSSCYLWNISLSFPESSCSSQLLSLSVPPSTCPTRGFALFLWYCYHCSPQLAVSLSFHWNCLHQNNWLFLPNPRASIIFPNLSAAFAAVDHSLLLK